MNGAYSITMDVSGVVSVLGAAAERLPLVLLEQLGIVSELAKKTMQNKAPEGVGGDKGLRGSIEVEINKPLLTAKIQPTARYADAVEKGSKPHWVSAKEGSPLERWAELKGLNVYAVQRSIAKKGTKAHPYIEPTYREIEPIVPVKFGLAISAFVNEVNYGRL